MNKSSLQRLCSLLGVSGDEYLVREFILGEISSYCETTVDILGNIIAFKKGSEHSSVKIMYFAHMDEVGLMVTKVMSNGFLRFDNVGGIDRRILLGKKVRIGNNSVSGVIGVSAVHLLSEEQKKTVPKSEDMYIDIGAKDKEDAYRYVTEGDYASFESDYIEFGDDLLKSKALDDRIGCSLLIDMIKENLKHDTYFAFTVGEECGIGGALAAANKIRPDIAIIVETTTAADVGGIKGGDRVCELEKGPVISFMDSGTIYNKELYDLAVDCAVKKGIPYQTKTRIAGGNDSKSIQVSGNGVKVLAVSVACRYLHTPSCVISLKDIDYTRKFLNNFNERLGEEYA